MNFCLTLNRTIIKGWAKGLKKAGYATDRKYPKKLISFIENFELYKYDDLVLDEKGYKRAKKEMPLANNDSAETFIIVSKGDTLYSISRNNSISVEELKKLNGLNSNAISVGQKLMVSE